jgi:hypothetical protein
MYAHGALRREALELYAQALPCPSTHLDIEANWVSMADWCQSHNVTLRRDATRGQVGRRPQIAEIPDVIVAPMLAWTPVVDEGKSIFSGFEKATIPLRRNYAAAPLLMSGAHRAALRLPRKIETIRGAALLLGGHPDSTRNTVDFMGALAVAEHFDLAGDARIVVSSELQPQQREMLSELSIDASRLLPLDTDSVVRFEKLIVPTRLSSARTWVDPMLPEWYRLRLAGKRPMAVSSKTLLVGAQISNFDEAAAALKEPDVVDLRQLSMADVIDRYASASVIVAPLGDALSYMVLAAPGTRVVALECASSAEELRRTEALAAACGHRLSFVRCSKADAADYYFVPPAELTRALAGH